MASLTRWVLAHKRLVVAIWIVLTIVGIATGPATKAMDQKFSVPGREGWETNAAIVPALQRHGRRHARRSCPSSRCPGREDRERPRRPRAACAASRSALSEAVPGARVAGYASTGSKAFLSTDGRTTFVIAYPPAGSQREPSATTRRRRSTLRAALHGVTVGGAPVHLTGLRRADRPERRRQRTGRAARGAGRRPRRADRARASCSPRSWRSCRS